MDKLRPETSRRCRLLTGSRTTDRVLPVTATVDSLFDEYARRYEERDMEGVTNLCLWPFLAIRRGEAIHLSDRDAVRDHFASAIEAYRFAAGTGKWTPVEIDARQLGEHSVYATVHWNALDANGASSETPGRATSCSRRRTGGASSRTRITSERTDLSGANPQETFPNAVPGEHDLLAETRRKRRSACAA